MQLDHIMVVEVNQQRAGRANRGSSENDNCNIGAAAGLSAARRLTDVAMVAANAWSVFGLLSIGRRCYNR